MNHPLFMSIHFQRVFIMILYKQNDHILSIFHSMFSQKYHSYSNGCYVWLKITYPNKCFFSYFYDDVTVYDMTLSERYDTTASVDKKTTIDRLNVVVVITVNFMWWDYQKGTWVSRKKCPDYILSVSYWINIFPVIYS